MNAISAHRRSIATEAVFCIAASAKKNPLAVGAGSVGRRVRLDRTPREHEHEAPLSLKSAC